MWREIKLNLKISIILAVVSIISSLLVATVTYKSVFETLSLQIKKHFQTVQQGQKEQILLIYGNRQRQVESFARDDLLYKYVDMVAYAIEKNRSLTDFIDTYADSILENEIILFNHLQISGGGNIALVTTAKGEAILDTRMTNLNIQEYFGRYIDKKYYDIKNSGNLMEMDGKYYIFFNYPIYEKNNERKIIVSYYILGMTFEIFSGLKSSFDDNSGNISLLNNEGIILNHIDKRLIGSKINNNWVAENLKKKPEYIQYVMDNNLFSLEESGVNNTYFLMNISLKAINSLAEESRNVIFLISIAGSFMIFIIAYFLIKLQLKPIDSIMSGIINVINGEYEKKIEVKAGKELQIIADGINSLSNAVKERENDLKIINKSLEESKEKAEIANKAKSQFLSNMSHEIRTPMNGIIGMVEIISSTGLTKEQHRYINAISTSADLLLDIINDILDYSKIEAGKVELAEEAFDFEKAVEKAVEIFLLTAHGKGIEIIYDIGSDVPEILIGDESRLKQILINLVGNAVKFTSEGEIVIYVEKILVENGVVQLKFAVSDTGIGIPEEKQKSIFDYFYQVDSSYSKRYAGTGLGLAISKKLVEMMGGFISVESIVGKGTIFYFTANFGIANEINLLKCMRAQNEADDLKKMQLKILIIDDNRINREITGKVLIEKGIETVLASGGREGLDVMAAAVKNEMKFDIIILDLHMPGMDGLEVLDHIKKEYAMGKFTIMLFSSVDLNLTTVKMAELGISHYLVKPVKKKQLIEAIKEILCMKEENRIEIKTANIVEDTASHVEKNREFTIILAEDNFITQETETILLKRKNWDVITAVNGNEVLEKLARNKVDLILMDIQMPGLNGVETTKLIRAQEAGTKHIPIIALTAYVMEDEKNDFFAAGMDDYISKPIRVDELYRKIENQIARSRFNKK